MGQTGASLVAHARHLATSAHQGQKDKIGEDYIHHPAAVVTLVTLSPGFQELTLAEQIKVVAAAWLHDVLEDTRLQATDLEREGFSPEIVSIVCALTHRPGEPREHYYDRVRSEPLARIVKLADVAHNSSEERLRWLDESTRSRLKRKYALAFDRLIDSDAERSWFKNAVSTTRSSR